MQYQQGRTGRIFIAKMDHQDDLLTELKKLAEAEEIQTAVFYLIGALEKAQLVSGPKECVIPPEQLWRDFQDGREIVGIGTVFRNEQKEVLIHLHGAMGKGDLVQMGCLRSNTKVYLVAEVIMLEILDTTALKSPVVGFNLLNFA